MIPEPQIQVATTLLPLETVAWEAHTGVDELGRDSYDTPVDTEANIVEYDTARAGTSGAEFVTKDDGSTVLTPLTLYYRGDAVAVPDEQDRVTIDGTRQFIVEQRKIVHGLTFTRAQPDHYRLRCRRA